MNRNVGQPVRVGAAVCVLLASLLLFAAPVVAHPTSGGTQGNAHPVTMPAPVFPKTEEPNRAVDSWHDMAPVREPARTDDSLNRQPPPNPGYRMFYQPWVGWGPGSYAWWSMQNCIFNYENQPGWWMGDPSALFVGDTFNSSGLPLGCLAPSGYAAGMPFGAPNPGAFNPFAPFPF